MHVFILHKRGGSVCMSRGHTLYPPPFKFCIWLAGMALASGGAALYLVPCSGLSLAGVSSPFLGLCLVCLDI